MTITVTISRPICWRPSLKHGRPFLGWRFCWLLIAVAGYPMRDDELFERWASGSMEWRLK